LWIAVSVLAAVAVGLGACGARSGIQAACDTQHPEQTVGVPCRLHAETTMSNGFARWDRSAPECGGAICISTAASGDVGYCTCRCDAPTGDPSHFVSCPGEFRCTQVDPSYGSGCLVFDRDR
jgi:hypothetical protein